MHLIFASRQAPDYLPSRQICGIAAWLQNETYLGTLRLAFAHPEGTMTPDRLQEVSDNPVAGGK
jgi:hypothetical protein